LTDAERPAVSTVPVRGIHRFDEAALAKWMKAQVSGYDGPLSIEQFSGGQSNPTYKLSTPKSAYVLRRKPPGELVAGAHAIDREFKILAALGGIGFPVPRVHALCTDDGVIGTWFYVMDMVAGRIFWDATFPQVDREDRPRYFDAMNSTLARLHNVDFAAIGLSDYGRAGNYFRRQIARWSKQYLDDPDAGRDPNMDRMVDWLPQHIPPGDDTCIVHGDFRCDNMIFHTTEPRVIAVLDWELSTLGHPLADFAYHLMMYRMPPRVIAGLLGSDFAALNIPGEADYVAAYCQRTGRPDIPNLDFYLAFNMFRFAGIIHGIKGRAIRGTAASANAKDLIAAFPIFAKSAWNLASA
jgi:aminoglycoside phosphotransferase (APT) family kinase protein